MNKSITPFYKTGWFYLLLISIFGFFSYQNSSGLNEVNQWNRSLLYKTVSKKPLDGVLLNIKVSPTEINQLSTFKTLIKKYPRSNFVFLVKSNPQLETSLNDYLQKIKYSKKVVLATHNSASAISFKLGNPNLSWFFDSYKNIYQLKQLNWKTSSHLVKVPSTVESNGQVAVLWQNNNQVYPSVVALALAAIDSKSKKINLSFGVEQTLKLDKKNWPIGLSGRVFSIGETVQTLTLGEAFQRYKKLRPKLIVIDDGQFENSTEITQLISQMHRQVYLYQGGAVSLAVNLLWIVGVFLSWWLLRFSGNKQLIFYTAFIGLLFISQYVAFIFQQWLPIVPTILLSLIAWLLMQAYQKENRKIEHLQKNHNRLLSKTVPVYYQMQQFDVVYQFLKQTLPDRNLLNKVFDVALQAETKNNPFLAEKLLNWINDSGIVHKRAQKKLDEYEQKSKTNFLDATMVMTPGQISARTNSSTEISFKNFGRYQVEGILGKGAMGIVFQGVDPKINRHVAIKTLQLNDSNGDVDIDEVKTRFFREAETAGNLSHANIVTIYDVGEESGLGYIAMDLLTGSPLSDYVKAKTRLSPSRVYQLMINLTDALDYAHKKKIVHRDIKPSNIIYDSKSKRVTITDFGIAYVVDKSNTRTGTIMGSPYYMSPEQVIGKRVDGRSDIFSLGVTFYQLLCGQLPFEGESIASVAFHITKTKHKPVKQWNKKLPASAVRITNKALNKDVSKRYQTMQEFKQALISALKSDYKKEVNL